MLSITRFNHMVNGFSTAVAQRHTVCY